MTDAKAQMSNESQFQLCSEPGIQGESGENSMIQFDIWILEFDIE
jgi:hypothetical protein